MIHPLTAALENIFNFILCLAFRACYTLRYMWFEWLVKLFFVLTCHAIKTDVIVAHFIASEKLNLRLIDFSVTDVTI